MAGGTSLRTQGVEGRNAPTKQNKVVRASDFNIAGLMGRFERHYDKAFECSDIDKQMEIFGGNINANWYGFDVAKTFWRNLGEAPGTLWIKSHVGFDGSAIDAVIGSSTIADQEGLASCITALAELLTDYDVHDDDAELAALWNYHAAQETADYTPASVTAPMTLDECITKVNNLKAVYNLHDADGTAHGVAASHPTVVADATDITTLVTLLTDLQTVMDAHAADVAQHTAGVDNVNFPTSEAAPTSTPVTTLRARAGYKALTDNGALQYGANGNETGYQIENGVRVTTAFAAVTTVADLTVELDSVIGMEIGDIITVRATGATPGVVHRAITLINESTNIVTFVGAIGVVAQVNDVVEIAGFRLKTYRRSSTGIVTEVETGLGENWCTMESAVSTYYVQNVHSENKYIEWTDQSSASTTIETFPDEIPTTTFLASGADGTVPTTAAHWSRDLTRFDGKAIRMLGNPETTTRSIQKAGEVYLGARADTPAWVTTLASDQTFDQLKVIGSDYQRSDDFFQVHAAEWLKIDDDFNTAPNAPDREIPNIGAVMGAWIQTISSLGIHYIPAVSQITLVGINGLVNDNLGELTNRERTDLAEYGINIIQFVQGSGFRIRNFYTASTGTAERFSNLLMMRNFIKISSEDSLQSSENTPNSFGKINEDKFAIRTFLDRLWDVGSTDSVPAGETFGGPQENADGSFTTREDHFQVVAGPITNTQATINAGERNLDTSFTGPTPAGSIRINTAILLR